MMDEQSHFAALNHPHRPVRGLHHQWNYSATHAPYQAPRALASESDSFRSAPTRDTEEPLDPYSKDTVSMGEPGQCWMFNPYSEPIPGATPIVSTYVALSEPPCVQADHGVGLSYLRGSAAFSCHAIGHIGPLQPEQEDVKTGTLDSGSSSCFTPFPKHAARFEGDLYTAVSIRGTGIAREGRCGHCYKWYRLKDSTYNYHMQFTHGICYATGKPFRSPVEERINFLNLRSEVLCPICDRWVLVGQGLEDAKGRTIWYRHAFKCQSSGRRGSNAGPQLIKGSQ